MIEFFSDENGIRCFRMADTTKKNMELPYYDMRIPSQPITNGTSENCPEICTVDKAGEE